MALMVLVDLSVPGGRLRIGRATPAFLTVRTDKKPERVPEFGPKS